MSGPARRRAQVFLVQWPFWVVLVIVVGGFLSGLFVPSHWLRAVGVMGVGMLVAAAFRLVMTRLAAGWLSVRSKLIDVVLYGGLGVLLFVFGALVHR